MPRRLISAIVRGLSIAMLAEDETASASWPCNHLVGSCPVFSDDQIDKRCDHLATALPASPPRGRTRAAGWPCLAAARANFGAPTASLRALSASVRGFAAHVRGLRFIVRRRVRAGVRALCCKACLVAHAAPARERRQLMRRLAAPTGVAGRHRFLHRIARSRKGRQARAGGA